MAAWLGLSPTGGLKDEIRVRSGSGCESREPPATDSSDVDDGGAGGERSFRKPSASVFRVAQEALWKPRTKAFTALNGKLQVLEPMRNRFFIALDECSTLGEHLDAAHLLSFDSISLIATQHIPNAADRPANRD
ncbi:hypothetical protein FRB97_004804 [Tulasnella sp. 331]|nr:hypothetical protein FRB97_004804 [Tulasnella sp. 331]